MKSYDDLTFADDFMFCKVMENEKICKGVIESLLGIKVAHFQKHVSQYSKSVAAESHGIRLDVYVEDSERVFDIEIQTTKFPALEKRIRYYQSVIDVDHLKQGVSYAMLPESFIVFICTKDPFDEGMPVYTVRQIIEETQESTYNDGTHKLLFNASAYEKVKNPLIRGFLKYISTSESESELTDAIECCVEQSKGNESWRKEYMTLEMKILEEKEISYEQGKTEGLKVAALKLLKKGFPVNEILECTGLTEEDIKKIEKIETIY